MSNDTTNTTTVDAAELAAAIAAVAPFVSNDENRPALCGVHIGAVGRSRLAVSGTDSFHLASVTISAAHTNGGVDAVISPDLSILPDSGEVRLIQPYPPPNQNPANITIATGPMLMSHVLGAWVSIAGPGSFPNITDIARPRGAVKIRIPIAQLAAAARSLPSRTRRRLKTGPRGTARIKVLESGAVTVAVEPSSAAKAARTAAEQRSRETYNRNAQRRDDERRSQIIGFAAVRAYAGQRTTWIPPLNTYRAEAAAKHAEKAEKAEARIVEDSATVTPCAVERIAAEHAGTILATHGETVPLAFDAAVALGNGTATLHMPGRDDEKWQPWYLTAGPLIVVGMPIRAS